MAVLSLIFSQLFRRSIENYPIYYLTGYILWQTFTGATTAAMTTLVDNKSLLIKVKFPMELFILTRVYTALIQLGYSLAAYAVMLAVFLSLIHIYRRRISDSQSKVQHPRKEWLLECQKQWEQSCAGFVPRSFGRETIWPASWSIRFWKPSKKNKLN